MTTDHPSPQPPSDSLSRITDALASAATESAGLRTDLHAAERARRRATIVNSVLLGLLCAFTVLLLVSGYQTNRLAHQLTTTQKQIADCSTVGGQCYEEGNRRTGEAIQNIIRAEIFMAECARLWPGEAGPAYDRKLEVCVAERLAGPQIRPPTPAPSSSPSPATTGG